MSSSYIGKVAKARTYAEEKDRVSITNFKATFQGNHGTYEVSFDAGVWECQCHFFSSRCACSHTMALERMLDEVLDQGKETSEAVAN